MVALRILFCNDFKRLFYFFFHTDVCFAPVHHDEKERRKTRLKLLQNKIPNALIRVGLRSIDYRGTRCTVSGYRGSVFGSCAVKKSFREPPPHNKMKSWHFFVFSESFEEKWTLLLGLIWVFQLIFFILIWNLVWRSSKICWIEKEWAFLVFLGEFRVLWWKMVVIILPETN